MKIKQKKQLNLPQLIEWALENKIKGRMFLTESAYCVGFDKHGFIYFNSMNPMPLDQTFTVEVDEEITEDTVIDKLIVVYSYCSDVDLYKCIKVGEFTNSNVKSIYILNDNYTTTLIWRDGKLVE